MSAPTVTVQLDKVAYNKGDKVTASIVYSDPDSAPGKTLQANASFTVTDAEGTPSLPAKVVFPVTWPSLDAPGTFKVSYTDADGRVWTVVDHGDGTATATTIA